MADLPATICLLVAERNGKRKDMGLQQTLEAEWVGGWRRKISPYSYADGQSGTSKDAEIIYI
jgi:hypothetical protein